VAAALHDFQQTPSVEGAMTLAFLDRTMGSRRAELNVLDSALKKFPNDPRLIVARLNLLGDAATDPKVVIAEIDKGVLAAPTNDVVLCVAGELYDKLGAFDRGLIVLAKALQLNPKNYSAHLEYGNALEHEKKNTEALPEFEAIVSATPPVAPGMQALAYAGLGSTLTELKRWPEADQALQKGLALAPESSIVLNDLAWLYATAEAPVRNADKAVELASKAATITRNRQPTILDTLAEAYFAAGNREKAVETEKRAILLAPTRADLQEHLKKYEAAK
jgi:tetratricopeptide (TPR) repeat protein